MVIDSKSLRAFCFPGLRVGWREGHTHKRELRFCRFSLNFVPDKGRTIQCVEKAQVFILVWEWLISFFQGADGGGQSLRKGRSRGKGEKKEWDLWPSRSQLLCRVTIPNTGSSWHPEKQPWNSEQWSACKGEIKQSSNCFDTHSASLRPQCCCPFVSPLGTDSSGSQNDEPDHPRPLILYWGWLVIVLMEELFQQWDFSVFPSAVTLHTQDVETLVCRPRILH